MIIGSGNVSMFSLIKLQELKTVVPDNHQLLQARP